MKFLILSVSNIYMG